MPGVHKALAPPHPNYHVNSMLFYATASETPAQTGDSKNQKQSSVDVFGVTPEGREPELGREKTSKWHSWSHPAGSGQHSSEFANCSTVEGLGRVTVKFRTSCWSTKIEGPSLAH